jgi:hypothetical protein
MVHDPAAYPWSSYGANTGTRADPLIEAHAEFLALGSEAPGRYASYVRLAERLGVKTEPGRPGRRGQKAREEPPGLAEIGL